MYSDDSLYVDVSDDVLHEVFGVETRFNQVYTADEPLLGSFSLFQPDVSSCFKLGQQLPDGDFVDFPKFFVEGVED